MFHSDCFAFDPSKNRWSVAASMYEPRGFAARDSSWHWGFVIAGGKSITKHVICPY